MKKRKLPLYHLYALKIAKKFKADKVYAKKCGWSIDYGFGVTEPHFHTPYGDILLNSY
jgi:hypothetical protein